MFLFFLGEEFGVLKDQFGILVVFKGGGFRAFRFFFLVLFCLFLLG